MNEITPDEALRLLRTYSLLSESTYEAIANLITRLELQNSDEGLLAQAVYGDSLLHRSEPKDPAKARQVLARDARAAITRLERERDEAQSREKTAAARYLRMYERWERLAAENEELRRILGDWVERDADGIGTSGDEIDEIYAALDRTAGGGEE